MRGEWRTVYGTLAFMLVLLIHVNSANIKDYKTGRKQDAGASLVDPCTTNPCLNGGTCEFEDDSYKCLCTERFAGMNCDDEVCLESEKEECGNVQCKLDNVLERGSCVCEEGKEFDHTSKSCKDMDPCLLNILRNKCNKPHEKCTNGKYHCEVNYKYSTNGSCEENFCMLDTSCPKNANCTELGSGNVHCVCIDGFVQKGGTCMKINPCTPGLSECEQLCNSTTGKCGCQTGFTLNEDETTCRSNREQDPECTMECGVGTCVKRNSDSICVCPSVTHIFNGTTCIDKCTHNNFKVPDDMCPTNECELDDKHVFRCKCKDPYEQDDDGIHCKRKAMCQDKKVIDTCANKYAICKELLTGIGYECVCERGFQDENGTCVRKCDTDANQKKCASLRATCELNKDYDVECKCPPLLKKGKDGVCDTLEKNSYTGKLSILKFKYEQKDTKCRSRISTDEIDLIKLENDLAESMTQIYNGDATVNLLHCDVDGPLVRCSLELKVGSTERANIILSPSICVPIDDKYCVVKPSLILKIEGEKSVFHKTQACEETVRQKLCGKSTICKMIGTDDFQCRCDKGFKVIGSYHPFASNDITFIQKCNDINECTNASACPQTTDCVNKYGGYNCFCKDGYKKKNILSDPKKDGCEALCDPNPCNNGTCVVVGQHGFSCNCTEGFTGIFCNTTTTNISVLGKEPNKIVAIIGGVLGAILIVLIIGIAAYKKGHIDGRENRHI